MKRFARLLAIAWMFGLPLLATSGWVRSQLYCDQFRYRFGVNIAERPLTLGDGTERWEGHVTTIRLTSVTGELDFGVSDYLTADETRANLEWWNENCGLTHLAIPMDHMKWASLANWRLGGFGTYTDGRQGETLQGVQMPYWFLLLISALPLGFAVRRGTILRTRIRRGLCLKCGYDLRSATTEQCSECGATIERRVAESSVR